MHRYLLGDALERVGGEGVVVVQERDVLPGGKLERRVGGGRDPTGRLVSFETDAGVRGGMTLKGGDYHGVSRAVVDQAKLPRRERLR